MAGAFTHMAIVSDAIGRLPVETKLGNILRRYAQFVTLGSVSPDLPYLGQLALTGSTWADIMHYHNTNGIVNLGLHSLMAAKEKQADWKCQVAWLCGFVGHLVADSTAHPVTECIVGPCSDPAVGPAHMECEMTQDIMIMNDIMNLQLTDATYTGHIDSCIVHRAFGKVMDFWREHAMMNCPAAGRPNTDALVSSYKDLLTTASGGNAFGRLFRHLGTNFSYISYSSLMRNYPDRIDRYYSNVLLPNGLTGSFRIDVFDYAVKNLVDAWTRIERKLFSIQNIAEIIPDWNLDTGVDQRTGVQTYWS